MAEPRAVPRAATSAAPMLTFAGGGRGQTAAGWAQRVSRRAEPAPLVLLEPWTWLENTEGRPMPRTLAAAMGIVIQRPGVAADVGTAGRGAVRCSGPIR